MKNYQKEIFYLHTHAENVEAAYVGFGIVELQGADITIYLSVKKMRTKKDAKGKIYLCDKDNRHFLEDIEIRNGKCEYKRLWSFQNLNEHGIDIETIMQIKILCDEYQIVGEFPKLNYPNKKRDCGQILPEKIQNVEKQSNDAEINVSAENNNDEKLVYGEETYNIDNEDQEASAWKKIKEKYQLLHPYGDDRTYVTLTIKDLGILKTQYQGMANNSFLLHGYFYYKYLILGKEKDDKYYLGVPGIFHEREKMMALMFGFEAFDCPGGEPSIGTFGYYLKSVELKE